MLYPLPASRDAANRVRQPELPSLLTFGITRRACFGTRSAAGCRSRGSSSRAPGHISVQAQAAFLYTAARHLQLDASQQALLLLDAPPSTSPNDPQKSPSRRNAAMALSYCAHGSAFDSLSRVPLLNGATTAAVAAAASACGASGAGAGACASAARSTEGGGAESAGGSRRGRLGGGRRSTSGGGGRRRVEREKAPLEETAARRGRPGVGAPTAALVPWREEADMAACGGREGPGVSTTRAEEEGASVTPLEPPAGSSARALIDVDEGCAARGAVVERPRPARGRACQERR